MAYRRILLFNGLLSLFCVFDVSSFQLSMTQFYFWFENKVHDSWILESLEDSHFVSCLQKCRSDGNCSGLALGPVRENKDEFARSCYTLSEIRESDCEHNDSCDKKGFQVFHLSKPLHQTTTEYPTTTKASTTDISSTTTAFSTTTVESSTDEASSSTVSTTDSESKSTTTDVLSTTTTESASTTTDSPSTTTKTSSTTLAQTIGTTVGTSTSTELTSAATTSTELITTESTSTEITSTDSTSTESTSTESTSTELTSTESTSTESTSPTTSTETSSMTSAKTDETSVATSTSTETTSSTSTDSSTTTKETTEASTSTTAASTSTTNSPDCSNSNSPDCQIENRRNSKCSGQEASIFCQEPRDQLHVYGLVASAPLFSDARMQVRCKNEFSQSLFKMETRKDTYNPFDGVMGCKPDHTITGIDLCFQGELKYVSVECNPLQPGFTIEDESETVGNSKQDPAKAICPGEKSMISLKLNKDSNGEINVRIGCSKVLRK